MKNDIASVTAKMLGVLEQVKETSAGKATLSKIRRTIGKEMSESIEVWPFIYRYLPDEFIGTDKEKAILIAIQLYALHQQGKESSVLHHKKEAERTYLYNIGKSLSVLRIGEHREALDRRFNTMITATTFEELIYHLRHLIKLLKAKEKEAKVDYPQLAKDLYKFLRENEEALRLEWAREYYRSNVKGEETNEN